MENYDAATNEFDDELKNNLEYLKMIERADTAVTVAATTAAATGAVPIPFADAPILIGEQVALMATIAGIFKIDVKKDGLKALAIAAVGAGGAAAAGKTIATNLLKLVPGGGTIAGGVISAGTAGAITLALGNGFIEVCKAAKMGRLEDITSPEGRNMLKQEFKNRLKKQKK